MKIFYQVCICCPDKDGYKNSLICNGNCKYFNDKVDGGVECSFFDDRPEIPKECSGSDLHTKLKNKTFTYDELLLIYDVLNTTKIKSCSNQNNIVTVEKLKKKIKNIGLKGAEPNE